MKKNFIKTLFLIAIDIFFILIFFSKGLAPILPFILSPIIFILFVYFLKDPLSFIKTWNRWLGWLIKFSFILVGLIIFKKTGHFPVVNELLTNYPLFASVQNPGHTERLIFILLITISQIGFMLGIVFNVLTLLFSEKINKSNTDIRMSFRGIIYLSILFTLLFTLGLLTMDVLIQ